MGQSTCSHLYGTCDYFLHICLVQLEANSKTLSSCVSTQTSPGAQVLFLLSVVRRLLMIFWNSGKNFLTDLNWSVKRICGPSPGANVIVNLQRFAVWPLSAVWPCCLAGGPYFKMNRHALLEIMAEARIQPKNLCYAGSARFGWNLLFYVHLDNIIEIQTSCATKPR